MKCLSYCFVLGTMLANFHMCCIILMLRASALCEIGEHKRSQVFYMSDVNLMRHC